MNLLRVCLSLCLSALVCDGVVAFTFPASTGRLPAFSPRAATHIQKGLALQHAVRAGRSQTSTIHMQLDPASTVLLAASLQEQLVQKMSSITTDDIAGGLFAVSLFPYLGFLYHLGKPENKTPELGLFGFKFLLAFVGVSIPAAIAAKVVYGAQLADVDFLHGSAESFLTLTNLFIVLGFRRAVAGAQDYKDDNLTELLSGPAATALAVTMSGVTLAMSGVGGLGLHAEPANALSLPTWMVHVSSLIEWLAAMGLVWRYAAVTGNPRWKGLTWGMLPFHSSGLCACTYHIFYNAPPVSSLVALQSLLTVGGDLTCWYAAYRIYEYARANPTAEPTGTALSGTAAARSEGRDSEGVYLGKVLALVIAGSIFVKWCAIPTLS